VNPLPVAAPAQVRTYAVRLLLLHPGELAVILLLHGLSTLAGLLAPWLLGRLVQDAGHGGDTAGGYGLAIVVAVAVQAVLLRYAVVASARLAEKVLARLREEYVDATLSLPLATIERAGSGDLVTRSTRDIDVLARTVQLAAPDALISLLSVLLTLGAIAAVSPLLLLPCLVAVPVLWFSTRWYLHRASVRYLRANASYSGLTEGLTETVYGAPTIEALRLGRRRIARVNADIAESYAAERYTLLLRSIYLPIADIGYLLPVAATLVVGGLLAVHGAVSVAGATAAVLYVQHTLGPLDRLLYWLDELQVGGASLARILGVVGAAGPDRAPGTAAAATRPTRPVRPVRGAGGSARAGSIMVRGMHFAYRDGHDVLHGIDLVVEPGESLAIVGPSGAGKSTLGRLIAGIGVPRAGSVAVSGRAVADLSPAELRREVVLVTQEHHVFSGTLRDNLLLARPDATDDDLAAALAAVGAAEWTGELGLDAAVDTAGLAPARAQQLALARVVLADPRTLVLDEATSLFDPRTARHLEQSLAATLHGRTVIAIAHRLHTAHDAGRVAVLDAGRIVQLGTHAELVRQPGPYAALWASWHGIERVNQP
jgi:ABC-type multidrug transport system fused ATPase/permease subunit